MTQQLLSNRSMQIISRFTFGYNAQVFQQVRKCKSIDAWFESQLKTTGAMSLRQVDGWFPELTKDTPAEAEARDNTNIYIQGIRRWSLAYKLISPYQVHEVMADFWSNLLNVPAGEGLSWALRYSYDLQVRKYALSSYRQILQALVLHPAMCGYLTNFRNTAADINENLGRELLELHTIGVGNYTEDDVRASARLLTGFTLDVNKTWTMSYDNSRHYVGPVTVIGHTFDNASSDGRSTLYQYLDFLALHPLTAARVARRLCIRFVDENPPDSIVKAVTRTYVRTGSDVKSCLRTIICHPDFSKYRGTKPKTPIEDIVATARAAGITPTGAGSGSFLENTFWAVSSLGMEPLGWPAPNGWPEATSEYLTAARVLRSWALRTGFGDPFTRRKMATNPARSTILPARFPARFEDVVNHQSLVMTGRTAEASTIAAAAAVLQLRPTTKLTRAQLSEWRISAVRSMILNSPQQFMR